MATYLRALEIRIAEDTLGITLYNVTLGKDKSAVCVTHKRINLCYRLYCEIPASWDYIRINPESVKIFDHPNY